MRLREVHRTPLPIKFADGKLEGSSQVHLAPKAEFFARFLAASLLLKGCSQDLAELKALPHLPYTSTLTECPLRSILAI